MSHLHKPLFPLFTAASLNQEGTEGSWRQTSNSLNGLYWDFAPSSHLCAADRWMFVRAGGGGGGRNSSRLSRHDDSPAVHNSASTFAATSAQAWRAGADAHCLSDLHTVCVPPPPPPRKWPLNGNGGTRSTSCSFLSLKKKKIKNRRRDVPLFS